MARQTVTATVEDFNLISRWANSGGKYTSRPTKVTVTKEFSISGIPSGAIIEKAEVTATFGSPRTGAALLTMSFKAINTNRTETVSIEPLIGGNGVYTVAFEFQANGKSDDSDGNHSGSCSVLNVSFTVTYDDEPPAPPEPEPEVDWGPEGRPISVFAGNAAQFGTNGLAVLQPLDGELLSVAGGACEVTLRLPIDGQGKWQQVIPESIIRVPVQPESIENAFVGIEVDLFVTNASAALREGPSEPSVITYSSWSPNNNYSVGDRVTYTYVNKNYQCIFFDETSPYKNVGPNTSPWWKEIQRYSSGSPILVELNKGAELYFIEDAGNSWYKMSTPMGLEGFIKSSKITFVRHITPEEQEAHVIKDQLFRVKTVTADTRKMQLDVYAVHCSYDLKNILIKGVTLTKASPSMAITRVVEGLLRPYKGQIATNLTTDENSTYSGSFNGKNGIFAFLDPDNGIVPAFDARFTRDNWDLYVLKKQLTDRGFRLRYGKNIKGITWKRDSLPLVTRVVPVAKDETGADFYLPETFVDSEHIDEYPEPIMERLNVTGQIGKDDGSGTNTNWTAETLCDEMRKKGRERYTVDHADILYQEITVDFEQLGDTVDYTWLKDLERALLYDLVKCTDERIGLTVDMTVTEMRWNPIRKKVKSLKMCTAINYGLATVAGYNIGTNSITADKLTEAAILEIANLLN